MSEESQADRPEQLVAMSYRELGSVLVLGAIVGFVVWAIGFILNRYVFDAFLCQSASTNQCINANDYAAALAMLIGGILSLVGLIRLRVYRPLLVILASAISLWGILQIAWGMPWYAGMLLAVVMHAIAYGLYAWVARVRQFWIAIVATVLLVVGVRLALML